jgi:hypothetical protein
MSCLNEAQIQSIVDGEAVAVDKDGEAAGGARAHLASCARCQMRVRERETVMQAIGQAMSLPADLPSDTRLRVERALADASRAGPGRVRSGAPDGRSGDADRGRVRRPRTSTAQPPYRPPRSSRSPRPCSRHGSD